MRVGIISGSGSYEWPRLADARPHTCRTPHGSVEVTFGRVAGVEVVHLARHGAGHARLSNHITHKANIAALLDAQVDCAVSLTVCGAVDPALAPGTLVAFDDLYFPGNRLPDGTLCTWHDQPGAVERGHWIFDAPISGDLRQTLAEAAHALGLPLRAGGCYGHVDGPRFNSRAEITALAAAGVVAVSQTAGPEIVLAGEAALPLAVLGYVTDYANGVSAEPQPVTELLRLMRASTDVFAAVLEAALARLEKPVPPGMVYRIES
ncbi:MAG: MTAP family purine nucleoside phosphorylase [Mycobacteriales bacterium]